MHFHKTVKFTGHSLLPSYISKGHCCQQSFPQQQGSVFQNKLCREGWIISGRERPGQSRGVYRKTCGAHRNTDWYIVIDMALNLTRIQIDLVWIELIHLMSWHNIHIWWSAEQVRQTPALFAEQNICCSTSAWDSWNKTSRKLLLIDY